VADHHQVEAAAQKVEEHFAPIDGWMNDAIATVFASSKWSYGLNADFEDHAEHEYMQWVADNPDWETEPFDSDFAKECGVFDSLADLFRQIGHDERVHKEESVAAMDEPRFK
jgi:hypothetical protein